MTPISERPAADVATRAEPGHWEGDLIKGARSGSAVGTLVEWTTRLILLGRIEGTDVRNAREGFTKTLQHVPAPLRKTLTDDRGTELAKHVRLAQRLAIQVFFADPYSPWQRGTNENTHGLLPQYLPKGSDLSGNTQRELNARPSPEHPTQKMFHLGHATEGLYAPASSFIRCTWSLKPPCLIVIRRLPLPLYVGDYPVKQSN